MEASGDNTSLVALSLLLPDDLRSELLRCCGSSGWVEGMMQRTPFTSKDKLFEEATTIWWNLPPSEWLMAFSAHPQIGTWSRNASFQLQAEADYFHFFRQVMLLP